MHVDSYRIGKLPDRGQGGSFLNQVHGDSHDNLVLELDVEGFITVKIDFYQHWYHLFFYVSFVLGIL